MSVLEAAESPLEECRSRRSSLARSRTLARSRMLTLECRPLYMAPESRRREMERVRPRRSGERPVDNELIDCSPGACDLMMSCSATDVGACTVAVFDATSCIIEPPADSPCSDAHAEPPFRPRWNLRRMACTRTVSGLVLVREPPRKEVYLPASMSPIAHTPCDF